MSALTSPSEGFDLRHSLSLGLRVVSSALAIAVVSASGANAQNSPGALFATQEHAALTQAVADFTGRAAMDAIAVEGAMTRAGTVFESETHEATMDALETMAVEALGRGAYKPFEISLAERRAEREVVRGQWTTEAFDAWAQSITGLQGTIESDLDLAVASFRAAGAGELDAIRSAWHLAANEAQRQEGNGVRANLRDLEEALGSDFFLNPLSAGEDRVRDMARELHQVVEARFEIVESREDILSHEPDVELAGMGF